METELGFFISCGSLENRFERSMMTLTPRVNLENTLGKSNIFKGHKWSSLIQCLHIREDLREIRKKNVIC